MIKKKNDNKGFTLVELIIVIAILAILVATVSLSLTKYIGRSREATDKSATETLKTSIDATLANEKAYDAVKKYLTTNGTKETGSESVHFGKSSQKVEDVFKDYGAEFYSELVSIIGENLPVSKTGDGFVCAMTYQKDGAIDVKVSLDTTTPPSSSSTDSN